MITQIRQRQRGPRDDAAWPALFQALFPAPPAPVGLPADRSGASAAGRWVRAAAIHGVVLAVGVVVMLLRIPGRPWDTIYNEDLTVYLLDGLARPWHLFIPYGGYVQLLPRLVGQFAAMLPLKLAAKVFVLAGALTAAACAVVVFHATAGHIKSVALRVLAAAAVIFLPIATLEIADSTVNSPWYLLLALFWVALWRPRTVTGMTVAAITAFLASSSEPMTLVFAPLFIARFFALRRVRDHAVTIGWAVGLLTQVPGILQSQATNQSRLNAPVPIQHALGFFGHGVVQSALGWHISWWLRHAVGQYGTMAIVGFILVVFFGWALLAGSVPTRLLIGTVLLTAFVFTVVSSDLGYKFAGIGLHVQIGHEAGSRYAVLGIFLIDCAAIIAIDAFLQRCQARRPSDQRDLDGLRPAGRTWSRPVAVTVAPVALLAVLAAGWVTDYRFEVPRSHGSARTWSVVMADWGRECARNPVGGVLQVPTWDLPKGVTEAIPCSRIPAPPHH